MSPHPGCPEKGLAYPEVTRAICLVPSAWFSQAPWYTLPVHLCRFRVRSIMPVLFPEPIQLHTQSSKGIQNFTAVTSGGPGNVHPVSIGYGCRPRLRGRLTLRGLTLRRNPWMFGGSGSRTPCVTYVSIRTSDTSTTPHRYGFAGLQNAPLPLILR